jgi:penicillin amidase
MATPSSTGFTEWTISMRRTTLTLAGLAGATTATAYARRRATRITAAAVAGPVTIARDTYGIPLITAGSREDALFGLGFAITQDRLWQMDLLRRTALGRMSEIAGSATLASDRFMRLLGIQRVVAALYDAASPDARAALDAFAAGVNCRMSRARLHVESRLLRYRVEPWRSEDSLAILRLMGWSLSGFHAHDLVAELLRDAVGPEWADAIFAGRQSEAPLVVRDRRTTGTSVPAAHATDVFPRSGGSNAWAVAGSRSVTGGPLLATDPHLGYTNPSIWCEATLEAPGMHVTGMTMPGVPGILIGRTRSFAWGITAAMSSQAFLYRERLNDAGTHVADGQSWTPLDVGTEEIRVKGGDVVEQIIRTTPRGPLLSDIDDTWPADPVSLHWTGAEASAEVDALLRLNEAQSIDDGLDARALIGVPTLNFTAADASGSIATFSVGRFADRSAPPGLLDPAEHPPRDIPSHELPLERDPARGWVAAANNRIAGDDYPYALRGFYEPEYRIRRIGDELESRRKHSFADMQALQVDLLSLHAAGLTPVLLDLIDGHAPDWALTDLRSWDFTTPPASRPTLLFQAFYRHWVQASLAQRLPPELVKRLIGMLVVGDVPIGFCDRVLRGEQPAWMSDDQRRDVARSAFDSALRWIEERLGSDRERWTWGTLHTVTWEHPFGQIPGRHARFVNVGPFPLGGDRTTVWPSGGDAERLFTVAGGPSMRLVADLLRPRNTRATNTLGQQGRPLSRHYRDQVADFLSGSLHPIWRRPARRRVTIVPKQLRHNRMD